MHPIEHIRRNVLSLRRQADLATIANVTQATVSRWESGDLEPSRDELARIREEAHRRNIAWDDSWFFSVPETAEPQKIAS